MSIYSTAVALFLILNAIGNIPLFIAMLARYSPKKQRQIIIRELLFALVILVVFAFLGDSVLKLLGISQPIIGMAGGVLLFIISLGMIFPKEDTLDPPKHEPMIVPLATPVITGPGSITAVMLYAERFGGLEMAGIIVMAWIPSLLILLAASNIKYLLGEKGMIACERFGGMLVCLISLQMFSSGAIKLIQATLLVAPAVPQ